MNVSEYIVKFLKLNGITHFFGYQGTMIAYFVDAIYNENGVENHVAYNEQGAALAACGYAKASGRIAVAYATSGPGAINLLQGIADAYYDSTPVLFITGQLNLSEYTNDLNIRQHGFQQTDVVEICKPITKSAEMVKNPNEIGKILQNAIDSMLSGRKGPAVIDIPMDVQRAQVDIDLETEINISLSRKSIFKEEVNLVQIASETIIQLLKKSKRPIFILGNGVGKDEVCRQNINDLLEKIRIPTITTLLGKDCLDYESPLNFGMIGYAYGHRYANLIADRKADLIISLGARLCTRQVGFCSSKFASNARIVRIEIDESELNRNIHDDDISFKVNVDEVITTLLKKNYTEDYSDWIETCKYIKDVLNSFDDGEIYREPNKIISKLSEFIPPSAIVSCDVGQHLMWTAQSFKNKKNQRLIFSGGHGAMGFALPAAIGAFFCDKRYCLCIAGDGAFQMNIQEMQWIVQEKIPIKIIILNNHSLGLIRQQQESIFENRFYGSVEEFGFSTPNFAAIASAYGISAVKISSNEILEDKATEDLKKYLNDRCATLIEVVMDNHTYACPKTPFGSSMYDQWPYIPRELAKKLYEI